MRLLLISNSTNPGEDFLAHPTSQLRNFLAGISRVVFLPYAAVTSTFNEYEMKVQQKFDEFNVKVESLHHSKNPKMTIREAEAFVVGGGNTFKLLKMIQQLDIIETLRYKVLDGAPYIGWSAGANVACPTICTTNDMPIVEPDNFSAFNLVRFQINPHFIDNHDPNHGGETREQRIEEFTIMDPFSYVVGLREGSMLLVEEGDIKLLGKKSLKVFRNGDSPREIAPGEDLDFLFE